MQSHILLVGALVVLLAYTSATPADSYSNKYDDVNLDDILKSERLLINYHNCLMDKGNCPPEGQDLKNILADALQNECAKCTDKQKENAKKVIRYLLKEKKDLWTELESKYDPDKAYVKNFRDELKAEGLVD